MSESCLVENASERFLYSVQPMRAFVSRDVSTAQLIAFIVNLLNHMFISFVTVYMTWLCLKLKLKKTATHAWLCTLGFAFLLTEGVMTHYQGNALTFPYRLENKTTTHWILQTTGGILGIAGTIQKIVGKETHFKSLHAKFGLAACIFCAVNMVCGLGALYSYEIRQLLSPLLTKFVHNFLGLITFILAMIAQFYGYETGFFRRNSPEEIPRLFKFLTVVILCLTVLAPFKGLVYRYTKLF